MGVDSGAWGNPLLAEILLALQELKASVDALNGSIQTNNGLLAEIIPALAPLATIDATLIARLPDALSGGALKVKLL